MLKELSQGLNKFINRKELVIAVVALVVGVALLSYSNTKTFSMDGLEDGGRHEHRGYSSHTDSLAQPTVAETGAQHVVPAPDHIKLGNDYTARPVNNVSDLLPTDTNSEWAKLNPGLGAGTTPDLLSVGNIIGVSSKLIRNANLQYRSDPVIPKQDIGPWNQSTIDQDMSRVPLELGYTGQC